ncbi:MAG: hypothetical protein DRO40_12800 [Thermoprotei archaeon]|nr:MAG: hypothetical protein DRO40_12800 [Thermoprotei archaeon]
MKLYEFKTKYMSRLALLETTSKREKELKDMLMTKLNNLRSMNLPNLVHTLYRILEYENVGKDFKELCKSMVEDISKLDFESD